MPKKKQPYKGIWTWIIATIVLGTFWHFGYEILARNYIAGLVFPINESVWEHLKIVFYPMLISGLVAFLISKPKNPSIWLGLFLGALLAMLATFFGFYLYSSVIEDSLIADILLYMASIVLGMYTSWFVTIKFRPAARFAVASVVGLVLVAGLLTYLTIRPPKFSPFIEKSSNTYGIDRQSAD